MLQTWKTQNYWCNFIQAWCLNVWVLSSPVGLSIILLFCLLIKYMLVLLSMGICTVLGKMQESTSIQQTPTRQPGGSYDNLFKGIADAEAEGNTNKLWAQREACISRIFADYLVSRYTDFNHFCIAICITVVAHHGLQLWGKLSLRSLWVWSRETIWITIV